MEKLISMIDFVLQQGIPGNTDSQFADRVMKYANFLIQKLELWIFVPCKLVDGVWVVLEEYKRTPEELSIDKRNEVRLISKEEAKYFREYQEAKERCLFEGFEIYEHNCNDAYFKFIGIDSLYFFSKDNENDYELNEDFKTVEDLVKYNLELTPTAQKQIEL